MYGNSEVLLLIIQCFRTLSKIYNVNYNSQKSLLSSSSFSFVYTLFFFFFLLFLVLILSLNLNLKFLI